VYRIAQPYEPVVDNDEDSSLMDHDDDNGGGD